MYVIYVPLLVVSWIGVLWGMGRCGFGNRFAGWALLCGIVHQLHGVSRGTVSIAAGADAANPVFLGIAAGGVGGLAVAILAPRWFDGYGNTTLHCGVRGYCIC